MHRNPKPHNMTRKKPGPKPLPLSEKRQQFMVRLTPAEHASFTRASTSCGLGVSAWLRMAGLQASGHRDYPVWTCLLCDGTWRVGDALPHVCQEVAGIPRRGT